MLATIKRWWYLPAMLLFSFLCYWGSSYLYNKGVQEGLDKFHNLCYNVGGYVINEQRQVIVCKPLSTIPKEEYDKNFKGDRT